MDKPRVHKARGMVMQRTGAFLSRNIETNSVGSMEQDVKDLWHI